jgi:hypothetical protein
MPENTDLNAVLELLNKIKNRTKRITDDTQNPSQASLDMLYSDVVDAYWALSIIIDNQKNRKDTGITDIG